MKAGSSIWWGVVATVFTGMAIAQAPPPAAAFAALPEMSFVRLSPNGQRIAWANDPGGSPIVVVFDLAAGKDLQKLTPGNARVRDLDWADDKTLIISVSRSLTQGATTVAEKRYEFERFLAVNVESPRSEAKSLLMEHPDREMVTGAYLESLHPGKPGTVIMSTWSFAGTAYRSEIGSRLAGGRKDSGYALSLFEVDTASGKGRLIESGSPYTRTWILDATGQAAARDEWNPDTKQYSVLAKAAAGWRTIYSAKIDYDFQLIGLTADGTSVLARSSRGGDRFKIWSVPVAGGEPAVFYEHPEHDVVSVITDRFTGAPAGFRIGGPDPTVHWIDSRLASIQNAVSKAFPNRITGVFDRSQDYKRIVARVESASSPQAYYLIDFNKGTADVIGESYPALADAALGTFEATSYKARDGIVIPAYLTLPPGRDPKNLPLIVFPHGGPYARDDTGFDWWTQFLATRGYAVLQPQFRGSWGFGAELYRAGHRQWGRGMQDDISEGVRYLVEQGIADPKRVCIAGASYGGFAALAGAAFTPELYACAVSVNGIADIPAMAGFIREKHGSDSDSYRSFRDLIGQPSDEDLAKYSPARSVATIRAPILLIHAANDTVVPLSQSRNFLKLMGGSNGRDQLIELPGEDHWLSTSQSRRTILEAMEKFLAAHLKP
ncbi:MAG: prolyl oligopeptidase family serine peptidase [Pseudomonadota bacterium]|nr:prolyl oligopeptidase family serine peptidase [Pseudomonadota bacterium]